MGEGDGDQSQGHPRLASLWTRTLIPSLAPPEDHQHHHQGLHLSSFLFFRLVRTWSSKFPLPRFLPSPNLTLTNCSSKDNTPKTCPYSTKAKRSPGGADSEKDPMHHGPTLPFTWILNTCLLSAYLWALHRVLRQTLSLMGHSLEGEEMHSVNRQ